MIRNLQSLYPWIASRRKVREENREYYELELGASCDAEIVLRWSQTYYARRKLFDHLMEYSNDYVKQRIAKEGNLLDSSFLPILKTIRDELDKERLPYERRRMLHALRTAQVPMRRELNASHAELTNHHMLIARRYVEEDTLKNRFGLIGVNLEQKIKTYFRRDQVQNTLKRYMNMLLPEEGAECTVREEKTLEKIVTPEYQRFGYIPQYRPLDIQFLFKHRVLNFMRCTEIVTPRVGEKSLEKSSESLPDVAACDQVSVSTLNDRYRAYVYGNVFAKIALHPGRLLRDASPWYDSFDTGNNNVARADLRDPDLSTLCIAAEAMTNILPGSLLVPYLCLASPAQSVSWMTDAFAVPLPRVLPFIGNALALDLFSRLNVEGAWRKLRISPESDLEDPDALQKIRALILSLNTVNAASASASAVENVKELYGSLSAEEKNWMSSHR